MVSNDADVVWSDAAAFSEVESALYMLAQAGFGAAQAFSNGNVPRSHVCKCFSFSQGYDMNKMCKTVHHPNTNINAVTVFRRLPRCVKASASVSRQAHVVQFNKQDKESVANSLATISLVFKAICVAARDLQRTADVVLWQVLGPAR